MRKPGITGRWLAVSVLLASVAIAGPAAAQGKPGAAAKGASTPPAKGSAAAAADTDKEATRLYKAGVKAAKAGQWEKARVALLEAFKLKPHYQIAANLGQAELMAGKPRDAAEHLSFFLREAQGLSDEDRKAGEKMLAEAKAKIGTVTVQVNAEGAEVLVDGQKVGTSPLAEPVFVEPGSRSFEAKKEGFEAASQGVQVAAGAAPVVELKLTPKAQQQASIAPVEETRPDADMPTEVASPKWRTWAIVGGAGLAAAGLGVGIGMTVAANAKSTDADAQLTDLRQHTPTGYVVCGADAAPLNQAKCNTLKETLRSQDRLTDVAVAGYVVGGVAVIGTAALLIWPKLRPKRAAVHAIPSIGSGYGGMTVVGSF